MIDFSGGEHREEGPHMMTVKSVVRDANGYIASVLERMLTPTQQAAVLCFEQFERVSRRDAQPNATPSLWIDPRDIHPDVDPEELLELVRTRALGDDQFWSRSGWKGFSLQIGGPRPSDRSTPVPSATPIGFRVTKNAPGASR